MNWVVAQEKKCVVLWASRPAAGEYDSREWKREGGTSTDRDRNNRLRVLSRQDNDRTIAAESFMSDVWNDSKK